MKEPVENPLDIKIEPELYHWVTDLPTSPGVYVIETESNFAKSKHKFDARFNGKTFDISNQVFKRYLKKYESKDKTN